MKTLAENTSKDRTPNSLPAGNESPTKEITSPSKMRVLQTTRVISSTKESSMVVNDVFTSHKVISFDLEGVNVGGNNGEV